MAATLVGSATQTSGTTTSLTVNLPQTPTAGNLLLMAVCQQSGNGVNAPTVTTPSGWTVGQATLTATLALNTVGAFTVFYRVADGTEGTTVSLSMTNTAGVTALVEEWHGLAASSPKDAAATGASAAPNSASGSMTCNGVTTTNASDWLWSAAGLVGAPGMTGVTVTWGGAVALDYQASVANRCAVTTATATESATGTYTPTASYLTATNNVQMYGTTTLAFKLAPPPVPPASIVTDVRATTLTASTL